jgi:hypothetical protein
MPLVDSKIPTRKFYNIAKLGRRSEFKDVIYFFSIAFYFLLDMNNTTVLINSLISYE